MVEAWLRRQEDAPRSWLVGLAILLAGQVNPWWTPTPDSVVYLSMARNLATRGRLAAFGDPHTGLPPGYPLLVAPTFLLSDHPFLWISIVQWAFAVLGLIGVHRWARRTIPSAALLVTALVACNVSLWIYLRRPLSEVAFLATLVWSAQLLDEALDAESLAQTARRLACGTAFLLAAILIREMGVTVVVGFVLAVARRPRSTLAGARMRTAAVGLVVAFACAGAAAVIVHDQSTNATTMSSRVLGTHLDGFLHPGTTLGARIGEGVRLRIAETGRLLVPGMFKAYSADGRWLDWNSVLYGLLFPFVVVGWARIAGRKNDVYVLSFLPYLGIYLLWPFDAGTRYLLPMLPVLVASLWPLLERLMAPRSLLGVLVLAHLGVSLGYAAAREIPRARECDRQWPAVQAIAAAIEPDDRIGADPDVPECVALMLSFTLDRPVFRPAEEGAAQCVLRLRPPEPGDRLRLRAGDYVLVNRSR